MQDLKKLFAKRKDKRNELPTDDRCVVPAHIEGSKKEIGQLAHLINEMCKSPAGRDVIETALKNDFTFVFDTSEPDAYGYADPENKICAMNPNFNEADLITTMAHELRHVHQFESPITEQCNPYEADSKSNLMLSKIMEADAEGYGCLVSWELKEQGSPAAWNTFARDFPEIAKPFKKAMEQNAGKADQVEKARTAAFYGWFDNAPRRVGYDDSHVDFLKQIGRKNISKNLKSFAVENMMAQITCEHGKNYFTDDFKAVDADKYVAVAESTKDDLNFFFNYQNKGRGDPSVDKMPVMKSRRAAPAAKSNEAKAAALAAKQERAAAQIRSIRAKPALMMAATMKNMGR